MEKEYCIEVLMTPHPWDSPNKPYFWCIKSSVKSWCMETGGWAATPEEAWREAKEYYDEMIERR
jgi:hypothetical protein